jgi:hypothetical protein
MPAASLSLDAAAQIQPTYCDQSEADACFCNQSGLPNLALGTILRVDDASVLVRVDHVAGDLPGLGVGDQRSVEGLGILGQQLLFSSEPSDGGVQLSRVATRLSLQGDAVRCLLNQETAKRPITIDTLFYALRAESSACVNALTSVDSAWSRSQCSGSESEPNDGCGFAPSAGMTLASAGLTSAAVFAALLGYRRRQRR